MIQGLAAIPALRIFIIFNLFSNRYFCMKGSVSC